MSPFYVSCALLMGLQQRHEHANDDDSNPDHIFWKHRRKSEYLNHIYAQSCKRFYLTWNEKFTKILTFCCSASGSGDEMLWDADVTLCCVFYTLRNDTWTPHLSIRLGQNETGQKHWPHLSGKLKMKQDIFFGCLNSGIPGGSSCQCESVGVFNWYCGRHVTALLQLLSH